MKKTSKIFTILVMILIFGSCNSNNEDCQIFGFWTSSTHDQELGAIFGLDIEFTEDGYYKAVSTIDDSLLVDTPFVRTAFV